MPRTKATDSAEQKLLDDVQRSGWHCVHVMGEEELEPFSYTVGLLQSYGYPELLIYGLPPKVAHSILSIAAEAVASGRPLKLDEPTEELLNGYQCVFVPVPLSEYAEHVGFALWYYESEDFPVQQVVWPSKTRLYPWHPEASAGFRAKQPVLGQHERGV